MPSPFKRLLEQSICTWRGILMKRVFGTDDENEGDEDSDNVRAEWFEDYDDQDACDGYLAQEMWKGYKDWLVNRPEELERFKDFIVRSCSLLYSFVALMNTNLVACASCIIPISV